MDKRVKLIIDVIQWILIAILGVVCLYQLDRNNKNTERFIVERKNSTYKLIYYSQNIKNLQEENKELYEIIDDLQNVESAVQIRYVYKYKSDTIFVNNESLVKNDSIYNYTYDNDTIQFNMSAKANDLYWMQGNFNVRDDFKIVTKNDKGKMETIVNTSQYAEVETINAWRKKKPWYDNIYFGPSVGFGYGLTTKKVDAWVGVSVGYKF